MAEQAVRSPRLIKVFVSSPGDVADERLIAKRVLDRLAAELAPRVNLQSTFWEHEPMLAHASFQESIERPSECDIVICILWKRLGTPLPEKFRRPDNSTYNSGTEFELEEALAGRQQREQGGINPPWPDILVYRKTAEPVIHARDRQAAQKEFEQLQLLDGFAERFFQGAGGVLIKAFNPFADAGEFEARIEDHLRELIERRLKGSDPAGHLPVEPARATWKGCPFRGFKVFEFEHRDIFFGRTREVGEVLDALRKRAADGCPFLLMVGESGCGKSSLVRAGVLPMLVQPDVIEGIALVRRVLFRQSDRLGATQGDLFDGLASALVRDDALPELLAFDGSTAADLAAQLRANPGRASALVKGALALAADRQRREQSLPQQPQARLVLVVDQLEELFTADDLDVEQRAAFFETVRDLVQGGQTFVLATLRSDFFHRCAEIPALSELKSTSGQYHLQPPDAAGIAQLIRRPAFAAGLRYEENYRTGGRLDDLLLDEAAANRDSLPLLEFLLEELYERRKDNELTLEAYEALGQINGVVARRAEEVFNDTQLAEAARAALPSVLRHLVTLSADDGTAPARKQAPLAAFDQDGRSAASPTITPVRQLVDALVSARLLTAKQIDDGTRVVEITHEKLLTSWTRVGEWLKDDLELLRIHQRVATVATNWQGSGRSAAFLLQPGKPLEEGRQLLAAGFPISPVEQELIAQSVSSARRGARVRSAAVATLVLLTALAVGGAWRSMIERNKAERSEQRAVKSRNEAETSAKLADEQRNLAIQSLNTLVFGVQDKMRGRPGLQDLKQQLLQAALEGLQRISKSFQSSSAASDRSAAVALTTTGDIMLELRATKDATELYHSALAIWERLAQADPQNAEVQLDLSVLYDRLGDVSVQQGDLAAARKFYEQGLEIRRRLAQADPKNAQAQNDLPISYNKLGDVIMRQGDLAAARKFYEQGLGIRQRLAQADPKNAQAQYDLPISYNRLGDMSVQQGDLAAARKLYEQGLEIARRLALADPQSAPAQRDLWVSYEKLGDVNVQQGNLAAGKKFYEQGLEICQPLALADPKNAQAQCDLSVSYEKLGDVSIKQADLAAARKFYEQGLEIARRLAQDDPQNAQAQRGLSISYNELGDVSVQQGDLAAARKFYELGLEIRLRLAQADPQNAQAKRDLSISYERLGDVSAMQGDLAAARKFYEQRLEIAQRLAQADPQNAQTKRDLAISYSSLGDVSAMQGDLAAARKFHEQGLEIAQRLAQADPENAEAQHDVVVNHYKLGDTLKAGFEFVEAIAEYRRGIAILEKLVAADKLVESSQQKIEILKRRIAGCQFAIKATGDWDALLREPAERLPGLLTERFILLARQGRVADVEQAAATLRELEPKTVENLYNAACGFALCVQLLGTPPPTDEKTAERHEDVELALACLKEAIAAGYNNFDVMRKDSDLLPLRELPEFQALFPAEKQAPAKKPLDKEAGGSQK